MSEEKTCHIITISEAPKGSEIAKYSRYCSVCGDRLGMFQRVCDRCGSTIIKVKIVTQQ